MNRIFTLLLIILTNNISYSQIRASIDETGKEVILNSDGTWEYAKVAQTNFEGNGNWEIKYFVDDFGDPTDSGYITNTDLIQGTFSNSATTNSSLNAFFLVSGKGNIAVRLFEYGSNAVNAYSTEYYEVKVKDSYGTVHSLPATLYEGGERLYIDSSARKNKISKMHNLFVKGGELQFVITSPSSYPSTYKFSVNADGYENAFDVLFKD
tara:strand:+ start:789 stop:1415 length:627 start_codon:yes stop_codon:yes gene_type:complete